MEKKSPDNTGVGRTGAHWIGFMLLVIPTIAAADPSIHSRNSSFWNDRGREIDSDPLVDMGEDIVDGDCASVSVVPSESEAGHAAVSAEVPISEYTEEEGEIYFCGGTVKQCSTFQNGFDWVSPLTVTDDQMALSSFIPRKSQYVTILRVSPDDETDACFEEIKISDLTSQGGHFRMRATELGPDHGWSWDEVESLVDEVRNSAARIDEQDLQRQQPEYEFERNDRQYQPNLGIANSLRNFAQDYDSWPGQSPQYENSYQAIAQARANALARNRVLTHSIAGAPAIPGVSEGIGMGPSSLPETCFFTGPLLADAVAQDEYGMSYRVRFFNGGQYIGGRI